MNRRAFAAALVAPLLSGCAGFSNRDRHRYPRYGDYGYGDYWTRRTEGGNDGGGNSHADGA